MYVRTPDGVRLRMFGAAAAPTQTACARAKTKRASKWAPGAFRRRRPIGAADATLSRADYYECAEGVGA